MSELQQCPSPLQLGAFLRDELLPEVRSQYTAHINTCPTCRNALQNPSPPAAGSDAIKTKVGFREPPGGSDTFVQPPPGAIQAPPTLSTPAKNVEATFLRPPAGPGEIGRIGNYRVLGLLGTGGMGMVFRAEDLVLNRPAALKIIRPDLREQEEGWQRLQREARLLAAIKHDNLVTLYQAGEENEVFFLAMELLEGESLEDRLKRETKLEIPEILRLSREIASGLAAIHEHGLIHRDIKPSNIWLEGKAARAKILDFGLARSVHGGNNSTLTQAGSVVGTPAYMSPEQARGDKLDPRSDLFSYGSVVYALCSGKTPFDAETLIAQLTALAVDTPRPVHELEPRIPQELSALIAQLLEKKPDARPASAGEIIGRLDEIAGVPGAARRAVRKASPPSRPKPAVKAKAAPPDSLKRALVALVLLAAVAGGAKIFWPAANSTQPPAPPNNSLVADAPTLAKPTPVVDNTRTRMPPARALPPEDQRPFDDRPRRPNGSEDRPPPDGDFLPPAKVEEIRAQVKSFLSTEGKPARTFALELPFIDMESTFFPKTSNKAGRFEGRLPPGAFETFTILGQDSAHAIGMHPTPRGNGFIDLRLDKKFKTFRTIVSQNDNLPMAESAMTFSVYGDEKLLWRSRGVLSPKDTQVSPAIDVQNVAQLTLEVRVADRIGASHALWFEPHLEK